MDRRRIETALAWFSLVGAFVHFLLETLYHVQFGQFLPLLIVDYIADALLVYAAVASLGARPWSASGLLAGAWGFAACLAYVACFVFLQQYLEGRAPLFMVVILAVALAAALAAFSVSLLLVKMTMNEVRSLPADRHQTVVRAQEDAARGDRR